MYTTYKIFTVLIAAIMALMAVRWIYFRILAIAKKKNVVDNPNARKLQKPVSYTHLTLPTICSV